jgi:digeranylgeranylglycerophospholipid reductase
MEIKSKYDVVVVGGGPAGCFFAGRVAEAGVKVALIEKKKREQFGHGWCDDVERGVFAEVGMDIPPQEEWDHQPAPMVAIAPDGSFRRKLGSGDVIPVAMRPFVKRLADEAEQAGVDIIDAATAGDLEFGRQGPHTLSIKRNGKEYQVKAGLFVDASGINGVLRSQQGFEGRHDDKMTDADICTAYRGVIRPDPHSLREFAARHDYESNINYGVVAHRGSFSVEQILIDLDAGTLDVLFGFKKSYGSSAKKELDRYLEQEGFAGEKIEGGGGNIPIRQQLDTLVDHRFMIVGDAACQVISAHGSGVASSLIAAKSAAENAITALGKGKTSRSDLWDYNMEFQRGRGAMMAYYFASEQIIESFLPGDVAWLMGSGMVSKSDFENAVIAKRINPLSGLPSRLFAFAKRPAFCAEFVHKVAVTASVLAHYKKYPSVSDVTALQRWQEKRDNLFCTFRKGAI